MTLLKASEAVLLVVDIQDKFTDVILNANMVIEKTAILIQAAAQLEIPIVVSEQYPKGLGHTVDALIHLLPTNAVTLEKTAFGCLGDEEITTHLAGLKRKKIMLCGIEAHVCVNQTAHQLLTAGYEVHLIQDAISSRHAENRTIGIQKMLASGAIAGCTEMALFELMQTAKHPAFKSLQALVK